MDEKKRIWTHDRIFTRMMEIIDEHEKAGKPAADALHSCNDLAYIIAEDYEAAIVERDTETEQLRANIRDAIEAINLLPVSYGAEIKMRAQCRDIVKAIIPENYP